LFDFKDDVLLLFEHLLLLDGWFQFKFFFYLHFQFELVTWLIHYEYFFPEKEDRYNTNIPKGIPQVAIIGTNEYFFFVSLSDEVYDTLVRVDTASRVIASSLMNQFSRFKRGLQLQILLVL